jgi:polysaccharide export outer membrane protein
MRISSIMAPALLSTFRARVRRCSETDTVGVVKFDSRTNVTEALAMAGGLSDSAAKSIRFLRPSGNIDREISVAEPLSNRSSFDLKFQRGDILYVPKSGFAKVSHVLRELSPAGSMMLFAGTVLK